MKTDQIKDELQERSDQIKVIRSTLCTPTLRESILFQVLSILLSYIFSTYSNSLQKQGVRMANKLTWENLKKQRRKP